ncbi:MAG: hypothetical protein JWR24_3691 [Actinoallomurus sp.]|nr:hypothetical protein [Actinoallomurus sp.]
MCMVVLAVGVCAAAAAFALRVGKIPQEASARHKGAGAAESPMSSLRGSERDAVPDACETLSAGIADTLAPGADRSEMSHATQSDQHSECAWSLYGSTRSRQLTVELRVIGAQNGTSATDLAIRTLRGEWQSDREGKDLADTAKVRDSRGVTGVGEEAYVVYTVDGNDEIGEAVANARLANVLVTVHYSGGDNRDTSGSPLSSGAATDGALSAARDIVSKLESHS